MMKVKTVLTNVEGQNNTYKTIKDMLKVRNTSMLKLRNTSRHFQL